MFPYILLDCLNEMKAERTVSGIFHLLKGKKSSQTFQDAKVYGIDNYYGIYPELKRETLDAVLARLEEENAVEGTEDTKMQLTSTGKDRLQKDCLSLYFSGMDYSEAVDEFQNRLILWVQIVSNAMYDRSSYIPVVDKSPVQQWVKLLYSARKPSLKKDAERMYEEIRTLLEPFSEKEKTIFVRRLTGGDSTGWTYSQLADISKESVWNIPLYLKNMYYYLYFTVSRDSSFYLYELTRDLVKKDTLTASSRKSILLYDKVNSIEKVAKIRRLKSSTIEDHLVESILVNPERDILSFISAEGAEEVARTVQEVDTKRLKAIREHLNNRYSYFQIRVVLAKIQKG